MTYRSLHGKGTITAGENFVHMKPDLVRESEQMRAIIGLHGHNSDASQLMPFWVGGRHTAQLVEAGYQVLLLDAGGGQTWNNNAAMAAITAAYNYLVAQGMAGSKIGLLAWSMGGGNALQWMKENPDKVSCLFAFAPMTDLNYFNTNGYTAEIAGAYGGNYANSAGHRIAGDADFSFWRGHGAVKLVHGTADTTVPIGLSSAFVTGVNQPQVTLDVVAGADHTTVLSRYGDDEIVEFFVTNGTDVGAQSSASPVPLVHLAPESSKYQDSTRTTLATVDGQPVGSWSDLISTGHGAQTTAGKRPLLKLGVCNGYDAVQTDGVDDYLDIPISVLSASTTVVVVRKVSAPGASSKAAFSFRMDASNSVDLYTNTGVGPGYGFFASEALANVPVGGTPTDWNIISVTIESATVCKIRLNGGAPLATFDPHPTMMSAVLLRLGLNLTAAPGDYQYVDVQRFGKALSTLELDDIGIDLAAKYGLGWAVTS